MYDNLMTRSELIFRYFSPLFSSSISFYFICFFLYNDSKALPPPVLSESLIAGHKLFHQNYNDNKLSRFQVASFQSIFSNG